MYDRIVCVGGGDAARFESYHPTIRRSGTSFSWHRKMTIKKFCGDIKSVVVWSRGSTKSCHRTGALGGGPYPVGATERKSKKDSVATDYISLGSRYLDLDVTIVWYHQHRNIYIEGPPFAV